MITRATLLAMLLMIMRAMLRDVAYDIVCDAASDVTYALIRLLSPPHASSNNVSRYNREI